MNWHKINVRFLRNTKEVNMAGNLLYNIYIEELKWKFGANTPFNIRVGTSSSGSKILIDDCHYIAKWIGAFSDDRLVGCLRIIPRVNTLLEAQYYQKSNLKLNEILNSEPNLVEVNRGAVSRDYRGSAIVLLKMFQFLLVYLNMNQFSIFFTTSLPSLIGLFKTLGFSELSGIRFKYEESDHSFVVPFLTNFKNLPNISKNIQLYLDE